MKSPIPYGRHSIDDEDIQAVVDVLRHGWLTQGPKVAEFEEAVARYVGARYAVAVSSGTAALHIACMAGGVSTGDVLVTSVNTFVASANCALYVGAVPQFSDIDPESLNLDPARLAKRCEELGKVKAIVPVHFAGAPCDLPAMRRIAASRGAMIIEDAAHAFGATYPDGRRVGCCADSEMTVFSFHPVKIIATAEGGIVTTNDEDLYRDLLRLRSHGINKNSDPFRYPECAATDGIPNPWYYEMQEIGFNYRMTDIQSALGLSQLAKVDRFLARRHELALRYDRLLAEVPHVSLTQLSSRAASSHHLYVVRIDFDRIGCSRAQLMHQLRARNIVTQVHYIPAHTHPYYRAHGHERDRFPVAEDYYRQGLSLPLYYGLTDEQQDYVVRQIKEILQ